MTDLLHILTLRAGYNATVVTIGTTLLGIAAGVVGSFAVLRKRALMGDALAHATLPGICLAFLIGVALAARGRDIDPKSLPLLLAGAAATGVLGVLGVQWLRSATRLAEDACIGIVLSVFFGAGVLLLSSIQRLGTGAQSGVATFIYGQTAAMRVPDAVLIGAVAMVAIVAAALLLKEFRLVCFDEQFARAQGWPVGALDLAMMALVVLVTVIGLQAVGLILVIAMLITPAAAARFWTDRLGLMVALSAAIGGLSGYLGTATSAMAERLPAGAIIVLVASALFLVSMLAAPRRGLLARGVRHARLRSMVARDHALRAIYEAIENGGAAAPGPPALATSPMLRSAARSLRGTGFVRADGGAIALTDRGRAAAARAVRNHRLWEEYLVRYAELAPSHVDRAADMVEHVLSPELVRELEQSLDAAGTPVPRSVHPLKGPPE